MVTRQPSTLGRSASKISVGGRHSSMGGPKQSSSVTKRPSWPKKGREKMVDLGIRDQIRAVELDKYCPHKIYNILFLNEANIQSNEITSKLVETSKEFEEISYLAFITYDDVIALMHNCDNATLPTPIKNILKELVKKAKEILLVERRIPVDVLTQLMKLKLIEVMYTSYIKAVTRMQKRRRLAADLRLLTDECRAEKSKDKTMKPLEAKSSISFKNELMKKTSGKIVENKEIDYTTISIQTEDDIVFDDNIHHHIAYYIFCGFDHPTLLREFIISHRIPIQAILKVIPPPSESSTDENYSDYWNQIYKYFDGPVRSTYLENTFLMTYAATSTDMKQVFEELLHVIRSISDIKLQHLNYIRHLEIYRVKDTYKYFPLECLAVYNNFLRRFPTELINIPILLDTLLTQVCVIVDDTLSLLGKASQHSNLDASSSESNRCLNPCSIEAFFKNKKVKSQLSTFRKQSTTFLAHEKDNLTVALNLNKKYGPLCYDITTKMLKNTKPLANFQAFEENYKEIVHKHDRDPSAKTVLRDKDMVLHFLYMFLFSCFEYRTIPPKQVDFDLTKNLRTFSNVDFVNHCRTDIIKTKYKNVENKEVEDNLYDTPATEYFWKEKLEAPALLTEIYKMHNAYTYCDQKYSPETDTFLIQFTDQLNEFGINTRIYNQSLITPVCLRDFCKYTAVEQVEWLEKNKPPKYVRKCVVKEECQGAKKITDMGLFPEYRYLIEAGTQNESVTGPIVDEHEEITFDQLVAEIKQYPPSTKLMKECSQHGNRSKILAYDLGTKYFQVRGAKTTFQSHDGVKLCIDNSRLSDEYPQCTATLNCRGNSLVLHSSHFFTADDYNFHMNLSDGTVISFIIRKSRKSMFSFQKATDKSKEVIREKKVEKIILTKKPYDETVLSVDRELFEKIMKNNSQLYESESILLKPPESILERLQQAATSKAPIYKVNNNLSYLKKLKSEFEVPLSAIVKRILHDTVQKEYMQSVTKRYLPVEDQKREPDFKNKVDARIALPNGLYISFYPSKLKRGFVEVKQEYVCLNPRTEQEEFRLFSRGGYTLIKRIDGNITVMKSNGDIVEHEKLDTKTEDVQRWSSKPCHCKNVNDYIKRASKIFKKSNEDVPDFNASRRAHLRTRRGVIANTDVINTMASNKVPYLKTTSLKFDGDRVCIEGGKVKIKKLLYVTFQNNHEKQEMHFERSDGFRSTFDKNGRQVVQFADGTRITSTVHVDKDLIDGYVFVSLAYMFDHPDYATVVYKWDNTLEILLSNNVVFRREEVDDMFIKIDGDIRTSVDKESVVFEKKCPECNAKYVCSVNISPLVTGALYYSYQFLHAYDSYNKHFYANFAGYCSRNGDYIRGPVNASNCNHYTQACYKRLFVVNRDFSGEALWTDNMVLAKKGAMDPDTTLQDYQDAGNPKINVYKFKRQIFEYGSYHLVNNDPKEVLYATFCVLKRMVDAKTLRQYLWDLASYFQKSKKLDDRYGVILQKMIRENDAYILIDKESFIKSKSVDEDDGICKCAKQRMTMQDKILRWKTECEKYRALIRENKIPCYFKSEFCKIIPNK